MYNLTLLLRIGLGGGSVGRMDSLVVQWLGHKAFTTWSSQKKKWKYTLNAKTKNVVFKKMDSFPNVKKGFSEKNSF